MTDFIAPITTWIQNNTAVLVPALASGGHYTLSVCISNTGAALDGDEQGLFLEDSDLSQEISGDTLNPLNAREDTMTEALLSWLATLAQTSRLGEDDTVYAAISFTEEDGELVVSDMLFCDEDNNTLGGTVEEFVHALLNYEPPSQEDSEATLDMTTYIVDEELANEVNTAFEAWLDINSGFLKSVIDEESMYAGHYILNDGEMFQGENGTGVFDPEWNVVDRVLDDKEYAAFAESCKGLEDWMYALAQAIEEGYLEVHLMITQTDGELSAEIWGGHDDSVCATTPKDMLDQLPRQAIAA
jgi:hypothetical protein